MGNGPAPYSNIGKRAKGNLEFIRPVMVCLRNYYLFSECKVTIPCLKYQFYGCSFFIFNCTVTMFNFRISSLSHVLTL